MSRLQVLAGSPRRTLGALAVVLAAVGITVGSSAKFTATSANPDNTFSAGTLKMSNSKPNAAIFSASNMKPGDVATGDVVIKNTGSLGGTFTLSAAAAPHTAPPNSIFDVLQFTITDCGPSAGASCEPGDPQVVTDEKLGAIGSRTLQPSPWPAGEEHHYQFTAELPLGTDNNYQGADGTATFTWDATT